MTDVRRTVLAVIMAVIGAVVVAQPAAAEPAAAPSAALSGSTYTALPSPTRILDTRTRSPIGTRATITLAVPGLPADATAAVITLTGTGATTGTYLSVFPDQPTGTSTVNLVAGQTAAITTFATLSTSDSIKIFNANGSAHAIVDIVGYFAASSGNAFDLGTPARILDTRTPTGGHQAALGPNEVMTLPVRGAGGVPADATAVVVNVTGVAPSANTYLALTPDGQAGTSTVNVERGAIRANLAVVGIGADGAIRVRNSSGDTHAIVDVQGWFGPSEHGRYVPTAAPMRLFDTRSHGGALGQAQTRTMHLEGAGQPDEVRTAAVFGLTAVAPTASTYLTAWGTGARPGVSNLNATAGETVGNTAIAETQAPFLFNHTGSTHAIADVSGYFLLFDAEPVVPSRPAITGVVPDVFAGSLRGAVVTWLPPADAGLPVTGYTVTVQPGDRTVRVGANTLRATIPGLDDHTRYTYTVAASNMVGDSAPARFGPDLLVGPSRVDVNAAGSGPDTYKYLAGASEDGRYVAMSVATNSTLVPAEHRTATAEGFFPVRKDRVTGETMLVIPAGSTGYVPRLHSEFEFAISDDGNTVAYATGSFASGYVRDLSTGTEHWVDGWPVGGAWDTAELSSDGRVLTFLDTDQRRVYRHDLATGTTTTLLNCPITGGCRLDRVPDLSDDGSTLLLEYSPDQTSPFTPTLMDTRTGELRPLTAATTPDTYTAHYSLSGDGDWVFYTCNECADGPKLMRIATTPGATPQRMPATFAESPAYVYVHSTSDDGTMVGLQVGTDDGWTGPNARHGAVFDVRTGETVPLPFISAERVMGAAELTGDGLVAMSSQICKSVEYCDQSRIYAVDLRARTGRDL